MGLILIGMGSVTVHFGGRHTICPSNFRIIGLGVAVEGRLQRLALSIFLEREGGEESLPGGLDRGKMPQHAVTNKVFCSRTVMSPQGDW